MTVDTLKILAPALFGLAVLLVAFGVYCVLCVTGHTPQVAGMDRRKFSDGFGPFLTRYIYWVLAPVERMLQAANVSPNLITLLSLLACAGAGLAIATGHLAAMTWLYALAGILDLLDGRLARATGRSSPAGALFDSVADRWGELFVLSGCVWYLRETDWLAAALIALAGSLMVSYTRARGEGLGLTLDGGAMQRAERMVLTSLGALGAAIFEVSPDTDDYVVVVLGGALLLVGITSAATAFGRGVAGYRELVAREAKTQPSRPIPVVEPAANMRITGEHTA
jgi:CDP-diacylglycerol--glycerol-3-phosphate 3-phosphatidyltransferase